MTEDENEREEPATSLVPPTPPPPLVPWHLDGGEKEKEKEKELDLNQPPRPPAAAAASPSSTTPLLYYPPLLGFLQARRFQWRQAMDLIDFATRLDANPEDREQRREIMRDLSLAVRFLEPLDV